MQDRLVVLEAAWDDEFMDKRTVRPFIDGWAANARIGYAYRAYNGREDLLHWLIRFCEDPIADTLYIAGHGDRGRLVGLDNRRIDIASLLREVFEKGRPQRGGKKKGVLIGACECLGPRLRTRVLANTNRRLHWLAGYSVEIPWLDSMLVDVAFLEYRYRGGPRHRSMTREPGAYLQRRYGTVDRVSKWVVRDFPLAEKWGFGVATR
ncbi:MAG: hypothetical protein QM704_00425 [Anaeromyxobacteraceae bacterium]